MPGSPVVIPPVGVSTFSRISGRHDSSWGTGKKRRNRSGIVMGEIPAGRRPGGFFTGWRQSMKGARVTMKIQDAGTFQVADGLAVKARRHTGFRSAGRSAASSGCGCGADADPSCGMPPDAASFSFPLKWVVLAGAIWALWSTAVLGSADEKEKAPEKLPVTSERGLGKDLPSWVSLSGEFRVRYEGRRALGYRQGSDDGYGLIRTRLDLGLTPASWLKFGFQGQDASAPGIRDGLSNIGVFRDGFDLRQAYARIGSEASPVALTVGRQVLAYGDQRLVGALNWTNTSRAFDAVKLRVQGDGARFDVFSAQVVQNDPDVRINRSMEGNNLHGVYGVIENVIPGSTLEPYLLWQSTRSVVNELNRRGDLNRYTMGLRAWAKGLGPWDYNLALVQQRGDLAGAEIRAWGYYAELGYSIAAESSPRLYVHYNFGSGDEDGGDGRVGGFVDIYPTAHFLYGYNDLVGWRNLKNIRLGAEFKPHPKFGLQFDFHSFWLATGNDALYNVSGRLSVAPPPGGATDLKVGNELDAVFTVPVSKAVSLSGGVGHMFPGPFLKANTPGHGNTFTYLVASYRF